MFASNFVVLDAELKHLRGREKLTAFSWVLSLSSIVIIVVVSGFLVFSCVSHTTAT